MPPVYLVVLVVGLLGVGVLALFVWEKLSPSRPVRRRRESPPPPKLRPSAPSVAREDARPRPPAPAVAPPAERVRAITDWAAHEVTVRTLVRQRDYRTARWQIAAALGDAELTDDRRGVFEELQAEAVGAEIGQLTADAVRGVQQGEGPAVLASLEQAAALLEEAGAALPAARREETQRRLSLAYTKVGTYRLEARRFIDAAEALLRALEFAGDDTGRRADSCAALAKALRQFPETPDGGHAEARRLAEDLEAATGGSDTPPAETVAGIRALLKR